MYPTVEYATEIIEELYSKKVVKADRFTTGYHHYVYDIMLEDNKNLVARITTKSELPYMIGALHWNKIFREQNLPLPELYQHDLNSKFPYIIMERLNGNDIGKVFESLDTKQLQSIAKEIADFQKIAAEKIKSLKFGYATNENITTFDNWLDIIKNSLKRSRDRISTNKIIDISFCNIVEEYFLKKEAIISRKSPIAFFHDLTSKNVIVNDEGTISGIVDIDDMCFGDPTHHLALTKAALSKYRNCDCYIETLINSYSNYDEKLLDAYLALFYLDFLSEFGESFNGNVPKHDKELSNDLQEKILAICK